MSAKSKAKSPPASPRRRNKLTKAERTIIDVERRVGDHARHSLPRWYCDAKFFIDTLAEHANRMAAEAKANPAAHVARFGVDALNRLSKGLGEAATAMADMRPPPSSAFVILDPTDFLDTVRRMLEEETIS